MTRSNLVSVLIGKSILETILVGVIGVGFYMTALPPYFHGWGEVTPTAIAGWAVNNSSPWDRVRVQLFIDGNFAGNAIANLSRPDVAAAGWARDEWHGYSFRASGWQEGTHEARVYALHESGAGARYTLQMLGDPIRFAVRADGTVVEVSKAGPSR